MLDRQDIDALLVGALYGELSSADEAALTAHLESHPGDRAALADLKSIRTKFQTSRIFELQLEPPQALSALLLQEAARRAPKVEQRRSDSWFQKFITMFVAHPAMAAAATLVLVVGVAGTVYMKGGVSNVEPTQSQSQEEITRLPAPASAPVAWGSAALGGSAPSNDEGDGRAQVAQTNRKQDSVTVGLAEKQIAKAPAETKPDVRREGDQFKGGHPDRPRVTVPHEGAPGAKTHPAFAAELAKEAEPAKKKSKAYVEVGSNEHAPKDLDRAADDKVEDTTVATVAGSSNGAPGGARSAAAPASPQPVASATEPPPAPPPPPKMTKPASELAWAKEMHVRVTALVKAGKCQDAAPLAISIRNRAPGYYNASVATDRELKPCMPYITDATEHSERSSPKAAAKATDTK